MQIYSILNQTASQYPQKKAIICGDNSFNYSELLARVKKLANIFHGFSLTPGKHVAILHHNCHIFLETYFAAALANLILTPINTRLSVNELRYILEDSETEVLIAHTQAQDQIDNVLENCGLRMKLKAVIYTLSSSNSLKTHDRIQSLSYDELLRDAGDDFLGQLHTSEQNQIAHLYYTSGTTGKPKGVILTHNNVVIHAEGAVKEFQLTDSDVWGHIAPMYHLADAWATFTITMVGGTHVLVPSIPKFEPELVLKSIQKNGITLSNLIPTMLNSMVNVPGAAEKQYPSLRCILSGGAPIAPELVKKIIKTFKCEYIQTYGMTETSPYLTVSILKDHLRHLPEYEKLNYISRTGRPFINVELKVVDELGHEVNKNDKDVGEIWVRGPTISPGYWNNPEETAVAYQDGWLKTGDLAVIDSEGYVNIVDRKKDIIITGGENVYSTEVEHMLYEHPCILEAAVIGVPDDKWGEAVKAVVVLKEGLSVSEDDIIDFCKARLAHFKAPKSVEFMVELPKTGSGKVAKRVLKDRYWNDFGLKRVH